MQVDGSMLCGFLGCNEFCRFLAVDDMRILELLESGTITSRGVTRFTGPFCGGVTRLVFGIILLLLKSTDFKFLSRQKLQTAKPIGNMFPVHV